MHVSEEHNHAGKEIVEKIESSANDEISIASDENLSKYEIRRKHRVVANKKRFQEQYAAVTVKKAKVLPT